MSEQNLPLVTVVVCNFNYGRYIAEAVKSACDQDYPNKRIIIVDDCSSDDSIQQVLSTMTDYKWGANICENEYAIGRRGGTPITLIVTKENTGPSHCRNLAIESTWDSHMFAILDADDKWEQGKLSKSVMKILEDPQRIGAVYTDSNNHNEETGVTIREYREPFDLTRLQQGHNQVHSGMTINRLALQECGLYDNNLFVAEDLDLVIRIAQKFNIVHLPEALVMQRIHSSNLSKNLDKYNQAWAYIGNKYQNATH